MDIRIQKQTWRRLTRYLLTTEGGSVQLELFNETPCRDMWAYIWALWVEPEHRRKGIAKALLDKAEEIARNEGIDAVWLEWEKEDAVWPDDNHADKILEHYYRRGYEDVEFGHDCCRMRKILWGVD